MTGSGLARLVLAGAVVLVWVGAPMVVVGALTRQVSEVRLAEVESAWVSVRPLTGDVEQRLGLALTWGAAPTVVAPSWDGLVEVVEIDVGDVLLSGDPVAVVGGVTRIAFAGERPFSRHLERGDRGTDVTVLHELLAARALPHGRGDVFDRRTAAGVRALADAVGAGRTDIFDPSWMVHLTAPVLTVTAVDLVVGAPAPDPGAVVLRAAASLSAARVTTEEWAARTAGLARDAASGEAPTGEVDVGADARSVQDGAELQFGGSVLSVTEDRTRVDEAGLQVLGALVDEGVAAVDAVAVAEPVPGSWAVPAAAVRVGTDGSTSVRAMRDGRPEDVPVEVVGGDGPSTTVVLGQMSRADLVEIPAAPTGAG